MTEWIDWYVVLISIAGGAVGAVTVSLAKECWRYFQRWHKRRRETAGEIAALDADLQRRKADAELADAEQRAKGKAELKFPDNRAWPRTHCVNGGGSSFTSDFEGGHAVPPETIPTTAVSTGTTAWHVQGPPPPPAAEKVPCKTCGGRIVLEDLSFCPDCTKHIRPMPFVLDLQGAILTKAAIVDFARIVGWHRIACWSSHRDALLGIPDTESNWARPEEARASLGDRQSRMRGRKDVLFGRPIKTTDYHPTDRLLSYDLAGDWTGQIINIGKPAEAEGLANAKAMAAGAEQVMRTEQGKTRTLKPKGATL